MAHLTSLDLRKGMLVDVDGKVCTLIHWNIWKSDRRSKVQMKFKERTIDALADMICGNSDPKEKSVFVYRSSSFLTRFFRDCDTDYAHDGSTRNYWVAGVLREILSEPHPNVQTPPATFSRVISVLMDQDDAQNEAADRPGALALLNTALEAIS